MTFHGSKGIIIVLDTPSREQAIAWVRRFKPYTPYFKIGFELFIAQGPAIVDAVIQEGGQVFLDLKFHDIPNTVKKSCQAAAALGVWMLDVHAAGGKDMLVAAREGVDQVNPAPLLVAVTVLTSAARSARTEAKVLELAVLAKQSGCDGAVASAHEAAAIAKACGRDFVVVTPGIRLPSDKKDDQARVMSPEAAFNAGSHFLVMGRSIVAAENAEERLQEMRVFVTKNP